jgi:tetratricopeptide (TPR) repeat protein
MQEYFHKASATYLHISGDCLQEGKTEEGVKYLEKGIDANRRGYQGQPNHDLAHLLNRLALAYHKKGEYDVARAFQEESVDIIGKYPPAHAESTALPPCSTQKC